MTSPRDFNSNGNVSDMSEWSGPDALRNYRPGYVIVSYLVSFVGAFITLELISRRTSYRGLYNWFLLVGASFSMGGIAIWCMQFVGNQAIVLATKDVETKIVYNYLFTALSFFIPIIILLLAFTAIGLDERTSAMRIVLGGALAGLGVGEMHYLGQAGISNYECRYTIAFVIGANTIAVVAIIVVLGIFFAFRTAWNTHSWRKAVCAMVLAGAVSGMHRTASLGTHYRLRTDESGELGEMTKHSNIIVITVLSVMGGLIIVLLLALARATKKSYADKAREVVLATAVFDKDGKIMVTSEGMIPSRKITSTYIESSFDDVFNESHPAFLWIFRASRNWGSITKLLNGMREHIIKSGVQSRVLGFKHHERLLNETGTPVEHYSVIFRELFCLAAAELVRDFKQPLDRMGVLFDEIIKTGKMANSKGKGKPKKGMVVSEDSSEDLERGGLDLEKLGKGQLLFLVKEAGTREAADLQAAGYRFAPTETVVPLVATVFQIHRKEFERQMLVMRYYAVDSHILEPGVHFALFAIRASMGGGFDVLVRKDARNLLPTMQILIEALQDWQLDYIKRLQTFNVATCLKFFNKASKSATIPPAEKLFASQLQISLEALKDEIEDPFFFDAVLVCEHIQAPCRGVSEDSLPGQATLICFRLIVPIHSRAPGKKLEFTSLAFFKVQQQVYKNSPDHAIFARKTHREFAPVLDLSRPVSDSDVSQSTSKDQRLSWIFERLGRSKTVVGISRVPTTIDLFGQKITHHKTAQPSSSKGSLKDALAITFRRHPRSDNLSERSLVSPDIPQNRDTNIFVCNEIDVVGKKLQTGEKMVDLPGSTEGYKRTNRGHGNNTLVSSKPAKADEDTLSYVDILFRVCVESR